MRREPGSSVLVSKSLAHSLVQRCLGRKHRDVSRPRGEILPPAIALPGGRAAGTQRGGSSSVEPGVIFLLTPHGFPRASYQTRLNLRGSNQHHTSSARTRTGTAKFESLKKPPISCRNPLDFALFKHRGGGGRKGDKPTPPNPFKPCHGAERRSLLSFL